MKEFVGVDHPAIAVDDLQAAVKWYHEVLGYEKFFELKEKNVWIIKAPDGTFIEMMQKDDTERPIRTVLTSGLSHLAFRVTNLKDAMAFLDSKGVKWLGDVAPAIGGGNLRSFEDPDGNMLQIVQR